MVPIKEVEFILDKAWQLIEKQLKKRITNEERFLLIETGSSFQGVIGVETSMDGIYVSVNRKNLVDKEDPSYAAVYREAFYSLIDKELLEPFGDKGAYLLSRKGHEIYSKITGK